ncbi:MAG TPA: hypothetical protein VFY29_00920 [Terriglobia bacterium]|nr:hypothetical protein [Terriglobia bacterium]
MQSQSGINRYLHGLWVFLFLSLSATATAAAQGGSIVEAGVAIPIRTTERIEVSHSDGRVYNGVVDADVQDRRGNVVIPRGSNVELIVRLVGDDVYALDLESVIVNGRRLGIETQETVVASGKKESLGKNKRTGKFVGGGAIIGGVLGAIAGGGKGAAIGSGLGAAAGAGAQALTRGKELSIPAETALTFQLEQPLQVGIPDRGFSRNGLHYHDGYGTSAANSAPYQAGLQQGRRDRRYGHPFNPGARDWRGRDLRAYQAGYERGFEQSPDRPRRPEANIRIDTDHNVVWSGPPNARVYVRVDNNPPQLFGAGPAGNLPAPWIRRGHHYVFILEDGQGRELDRDENDLRGRYSSD